MNLRDLVKTSFAVIFFFGFIQCRQALISKSPWQLLQNDLTHTTGNAKNDFEKVCIIRSRIAELIDVPDGNRNDIDLLFPDHRQFDLNRYVGIFEKDSAGAICGTTSHILKKVYESFGYECSTLDVGDREQGLSHVVCLVKIKHAGNVIEVIQDATYNLAFVNNKAEPLDYFEMSSLLKDKKLSEIKILSEVKYCDALIDSIPPLSESEKINCLPLVKSGKLPSGKMKYRIPKTLEFVLLNCGKRGGQYLDMIERNGYSRDFINLFVINPIVSR